MDNNEVLQRIKEAVSLDDARLVAIFALGGESVDEATTQAMLGDPRAPGSTPCLAVLRRLVLRAPASFLVAVFSAVQLCVPSAVI